SKMSAFSPLPSTRGFSRISKLLPMSGPSRTVSTPPLPWREKCWRTPKSLRVASTRGMCGIESYIGGQRVALKGRYGSHRLLASEYKCYLRLVQPKKAGVDAIDFARQSIGRDLARKRHKAKLSQAEVAKRAKVRIETISRLESGRANPTAETVQKI